jgi:prepilin-type N-terminal cleavage/methylation domain-containing protein
MINKHSKFLAPSRSASLPQGSSGFTLIELLVAMTVFLIVGGAAMTLFKQHASTFGDQQNQVGVNISLRNALSQVEMDTVNAGTGYYSTTDIASSPIGVTISNQAGGAGCTVAGSFLYNAACFDTLNIVALDPATTPAHPDNAAGTGGCTLTNNTTTNLVVPTGNDPTGKPWTAASYAGQFSKGDQILYINGQGTFMSTAILTGAGGTAAPEVVLSHNATNADGTNNTSPVNDRLGLTTDPANPLKKTTNSFCAATDWVVRLLPISYTVNVANAVGNPGSPSDPQLIRTQNGVQSVVADQIIGFKVGAALLNTAAGNTSGAYNYDTTTYSNGVACAGCFDLIRSVRVTVIGRTPPNLASANNFKNQFDGGPYKIESLSVIINPRNLSMNDVNGY